MKHSKDQSGKVILSLLVGATAGVVAGLLLAPETGDETRSGLKKSASKWGGDLNKWLKVGLAKLNELQEAASTAEDSESRTAADDLLTSMTGSASMRGADKKRPPRSNAAQSDSETGSETSPNLSSGGSGSQADAPQSDESGYGRSL